MIRKILYALVCLIGFGIYIYLEWDFQKGYTERREQQKVEHEFYQQYKDSINKLN